VFRAPQPTGKPGRPPLVVWADLHIIQVIKQDTRRRVRAVRRTLSYGNQSTAEALGQATQVGWGVFTPASIERLHGTFRTGIRPLTRRSRTPARDVAQVEAAMVWRGVVYTFCRVHRSLDASPAMAADRTDHVWSIRE